MQFQRITHNNSVEEKSEMATLTAAQIDKMTPPQLRKAVQEAGGDPMKMGKGAPEQLRAFLKSKIAKGKVAPQAVKAAVVAKVAKAGAAASGIVKPKPAVVAAVVKATAAAQLQRPPVVQQVVKPVVKAVQQVEEEPPVAEAMALPDSWAEQMELRLRTIEEKLGISNAVLAPEQEGGEQAQPEGEVLDYETLLKDYLENDPDTGAPTLLLDAPKVAVLDEQQLRACGVIMGTPFEEGTEIRVMRQAIIEALAAMDPSAEVEEPKPEPKPQAAASKSVAGIPRKLLPGQKYTIGTVVVVINDGDEWDCVVRGILLDKKGAFRGYDMEFINDGGENFVVEVDSGMVKGLSTRKL
jgi:hypothetical protein